MKFAKSKTEENLMKAFAGESMARNRYTFAESAAKHQKLFVIGEIFRFTANQEKEHAEIFYNILCEKGGGNVDISGGYPADTGKDALSLLRASVHNEFEENSPVYPSFSDDAKYDGFTDVSVKFALIAKIEKTHGERFLRYADMLENGSLFLSDREEQWLCLNCGHIHTGKGAPEMCPVCTHDKGYFIRASAVIGS